MWQKKSYYHNRHLNINIDLMIYSLPTKRYGGLRYHAPNDKNFYKADGLFV